MKSYAEGREAIYGPLRSEGVFDWDWLYGQEYALARPKTITGDQCQELRLAAAGLSRVYRKVTEAAQKCDDEFMRMLGLPEATYEAIRFPGPDHTSTMLGRFDFVQTDQGFKMLEFNSDTPGGVVEAFYVNGRVCEFYGVADPNCGREKDLTRAFQRMAELYRSNGMSVSEACFSALDWHKEDAGTARYLSRISGINGEFVPLADLRADESGMHYGKDGESRRIGLWYRLHPLGVLAEDKDDDGFPTGALVLDLIAKGQVATINPPGALIAQSKALQALIWGLYEEGGFFLPEEQECIGRYMLPTYLENRFEGQGPYVTKPVLGREGGGVTLYRADGSVLERDQEPNYWEQPFVYQQYVELPEEELETVNGRVKRNLIWSVFAVDGKPSAVGARAGGRITDDLAYYVPVCLADEKQEGQGYDASMA